LIVLSGGIPLLALLVGYIVSGGLMFGLGWLDVSRLRDRGYEKTVSPAWVLLLAPVYFIIRLVHVGPGGIGPLATNVVVGVLVAAAAIAVILQYQSTSFGSL
jgi:hypothetical protein